MKIGTDSFSRPRSLTGQAVKVQKRPSVIPALIVVFLLISMSLFYVWSRIETIRINYTISELQENLKKEVKQNEELQGKVAQLKNPERVARLAEKNLGLAFPVPSQVWPIAGRGDDSSLKVARP
jgi:cell division protein FtsL